MGAHDLLADVPVLQGGFAPVMQELSVTLTDIQGQVPTDLNGLYVRNGPNRRFEAPGRYHWFDGDGMLHALRFDRGQVSYQNRWIQTDGLREELAADQALWQGIKDPPRQGRPDMPLKNTANTDVKFYAGHLLAMWYRGGAMYQVNPTDLSTVGTLTVDPQDPSLALSAHSKVDERTGELLFFAYGNTPPYMHYGVLDRLGQLQTLIPVALPGPRLPHDMAVTAHYSVLHDLPLFNDLDALAAGRQKLKFHHHLPTRFAVVPRHGTAAQIRWFEAKPTYLYHVSNAWEEDDGCGGTVIVMTGTPFRQTTPEADEQRLPRLLATLENDCVFYEWRLNLRTGHTHERVLDDIINQEFPVINSAFLGHKTRYAWNLLMAPSHRPEEPRFCGYVRHDLLQGNCTTYHEGPGKWFSEASFAPKDQPQEEDDGYLVGFVWDDHSQASYVVVSDAHDIARGPLARIRLPQRVPNGFHATWVSAQRLARGY